MVKAPVRADGDDPVQAHTAAPASVLARGTVWPVRAGSVLATAAPPFSDPADHADPTPDPDPARADLAGLGEQVATLREQNQLLLARQDGLRREVEALKARVQQLEADREAAEGLIADLTDRVGRNASRLGLAPLDVEDDDHDRLRTTFPFPPERSAASGR